MPRYRRDDDSGDLDRPARKGGFPVWVWLVLGGLALGVLVVAGSVVGGVVYFFATRATTPATISPPTAVKPEDRLPTTLKRTNLGRDAAYWGRLLHDSDPWVAGEAITGVYNCGEEGLRFAADAMKSNSAIIRSNGARALSSEGRGYEKELLPLLLAMLENPESFEWSAAAEGISVCGFKSAEGRIREVADKAQNEQCRAAMRRWADNLSKGK